MNATFIAILPEADLRIGAARRSNVDQFINIDESVNSDVGVDCRRPAALLFPEAAARAPGLPGDRTAHETAQRRES